MKKIAALLFVFALAFACSEPTENVEDNIQENVELVAYDYYGDSTFAIDEAIESTKLIEYMGDNDSVEVTVSGKIDAVCKKKGCWMSVVVDDGSSMHVSYDYEFLLPLNCDGQEMVMHGYAHYDTIPVSHLKHLAEDAEKSQEEIDQITEPKITLAYLATGVMIKK